MTDMQLWRNIQKVAKDIARLNNRVSAIERAPQGRFRSWTGTQAIYDYDGNIRQRIGLQPDGTYTAVELVGPPPPQPTPPVLTSVIGGIKIAWDGQFELYSRPLDFNYVEVHLSPTAGFTPVDSTQITTLRGDKGETFTHMLDGDTTVKYVKFVAVSNSRAESVPSDEASGVALAITTGSDGNAPGSSPAPLALGTVGAILVRWAPVVNADLVTYELHMSITSGFTPDSTTLAHEGPETSFTVRTLPDGTPLDYASTYYFKIIAKDEDGAATASAEGSGSMVQITGPDVAAEYVYAGNIIADQIDGGTIRSDILLSSKIKTADTGARVEQDALGIRAYAPDNTERVNITTDPTQDHKFSGQIHATSSQVDNGITLSGTSVLSPGSVLSMASSYEKPPLPPTLFRDFDIVYSTAQPTGSTSQIGGGLVSDGSQWLLGFRNATTSTAEVRSMALTGGGSTTLRISIPSASEITGVTVLGSHIYTLVKIGSQWRVYGHNRVTYAADPTPYWVYSTLTDLYKPGIGNDGTNLVIAQFSSTPTLTVRTYSPTGTLVSTKNTSVGSPYQGDVQSVLRGTFDYGDGVSRYVVSVRRATFDRDTANTHVLPDTGGTLACNTTEHWPPISADAWGMYWDGTTFWERVGYSAIGARTDIYKSSGSVLNRWVFGYTWYDSDATGGTHESMLSGGSAEYVPRRGSLTIEATSGIPDNGSSDDPDSVKWYASLDPGPTYTYWLQTTSAPGVDTINQAAIPITSGTNPPGVSSFPAASPALLQTTDGNTFISGDGSAEFGNSVQFDSFIDVYDSIYLNAGDFQMITPPGDGDFYVECDSVVLDSAAAILLLASEIQVNGNFKDGLGNGWITPSMSNSWVNYGAPFPTCQYRRVGNIVYLKGLIKNGTVGQVATSLLPAAFRPTEQLVFSVACDSGMGRVDIQTTGGILIGAPSTNGWVSLNGISYFTD